MMADVLKLGAKEIDEIRSQYMEDAKSEHPQWFRELKVLV